MKKGKVLFILFLVGIVTGLALPSFVSAQGTCFQNCDWVGPPCNEGFLTNNCDPGFAPVPDPNEICGEILLKPACINGISCTCVFNCLASEAGLCTDGIDNDCDGNTDCSDSECTCDDTCDTTPPSRPSSSVPSLTTDTTPTVSYSGATDNCGVAFVSHIRRTGAGCGGGIVRTSISSSNPSGSFTFSNQGLGWFSSQFKVTDNAGNSGLLSSCANTHIVQCITNSDCAPGETCTANICQDPDNFPALCTAGGWISYPDSKPFTDPFGLQSPTCCGDDPNEFDAIDCVSGTTFGCCLSSGLSWPPGSNSICVSSCPSSCSDNDCSSCQACSKSQCDTGSASGCYWDGSQCILDGTSGGGCFPQPTCTPACFVSGCIGGAASCGSGVTCCFSFQFGRSDNWCGGSVTLI